MKIIELFDIAVARSKGADDYDNGATPFITNTTMNNGITKYVTPFPEDKVFDGPAICISGLGFATVHYGQFLPKGNGGDSATILTPKTEFSANEILYYAALFNCSHNWRFSFGRKASKRRIQDLDLSPVFADSTLGAGKVLSEFSGHLRTKMDEYEDSYLGSEFDNS